MEPEPKKENEEYVRPELFELGDAAELTRGGGNQCIDNPNGDTKGKGCPASGH